MVAELCGGPKHGNFFRNVIVLLDGKCSWKTEAREGRHGLPITRSAISLCVGVAGTAEHNPGAYSKVRTFLEQISIVFSVSSDVELAVSIMKPTVKISMPPP